MKLINKPSVAAIIFYHQQWCLTSCEAIQNANNTQKGAVIGTAAGAVLGAVIGNNVGKAVTPSRCRFRRCSWWRSWWSNR